MPIVAFGWSSKTEVIDLPHLLLLVWLSHNGPWTLKSLAITKELFLFNTELMSSWLQLLARAWTNIKSTGPKFAVDIKTPTASKEPAEGGGVDNSVKWDIEGISLVCLIEPFELWFGKISIVFHWVIIMVMVKKRGDHHRCSIFDFSSPSYPPLVTFPWYLEDFAAGCSVKYVGRALLGWVAKLHASGLLVDDGHFRW